jgi:DNA-binding protein Alba
MSTVVHEKTSSQAQNTLPKIPPSVLLIGKKRALDYIAPALFRINNTGELIIKATGSLSIVTAVDVAEMVKRDVENLATKSITVGTNELMISTGERKLMSCIQIHLFKVNPMVAVVASSSPPAIKTAAEDHPFQDTSASAIAEVEATPTIITTTEENVVNKPKARKRSANSAATTTRKKTTATTSKKKKKSTSA